VLGILVVVSAFLGFQRFYVAPQQKEALKEMFVAEQYFQKDSFNLAINGDGNYPGFLDIIDDYKITKAANLAQYYTGISYLHLGNYEDAVKHLKKFKAGDYMVAPVSMGAIGDAYTEMGEYKKAIAQYEKAASFNENEFTSPIYLSKAALLYQEQGELQKALDIYKKIEKKYPKSQEGRSAEKQIAKLKLKLEK
jgi:tetratricopeptide (TPR) repeat protein